MSYRPIDDYDAKNEDLPLIEKRKGSLILQLFAILLFFVIIAVVIFLYSPYSKINDIHIEGLELTDNNLILQATRIEIGDSFLKVNTQAIKETIEKLNTVKNVQVNFLFPDTLKITLQEKKIVAYVYYENNTMLPLLEDGTTLHNSNNDLLDKQRPIVSSLLNDTSKYKLANQLKDIPDNIIFALSEFKIDEQGEIVTIYTNDGNELRMLFDEVNEKLLLFKDIKYELQFQEQKKGIINMFDAIWFTTYEEILKDIE
jgi:cell division protein FtsQ